MVSHRLKCIFVHIPKAAGQSIERTFLDYLGLDWSSREALLLRENADPGKGPPRLAHMTAHEYQSLGYVTREQFDTYFKFAFVRNPWARLVSEYVWAGHDQSVDFKTWLMQKMPQPAWSDDYRHVMPQYKYLYDREENCLVNFVGRFEDLKADFANVSQRLGVPLPTLTHSNAGSGRLHPTSIPYARPWRTAVAAIKARLSGGAIKKRYCDYYDDESRQFVREHYAKDVEVLGYSFSGMCDLGKHKSRI